MIDSRMATVASARIGGPLHDEKALQVKKLGRSATRLLPALNDRFRTVSGLTRQRLRSGRFRPIADIRVGLKWENSNSVLKVG